MAASRTSVERVVIPVAGVIDGKVDVSNAGSAYATASLTIGTVLVRIGTARAAEQIGHTWRMAALHLGSLAVDASQNPLVPELGVGPVGVVLSVEPIVFTRYDLVTEHGSRNYLRLQVGPVVWMVLDRHAYWSTRRLWERVEQHLSP